MNEETRNHTCDMQNEEPTVLDLFKSIFKDWNSFFRFVASVFDGARREQVNRSLAQEGLVVDEPEVEPSSGSAIEGQPHSFPWRAMLGLGLALGAQRLLEPPDPNIEFSIALYVMALGLILWSLIVNGWDLPPIRSDHARRDPQTIRVLPFVIAGGLAVAAYTSFAGNLFEAGNFTLWLLAIGFFVYSLWLPYRRSHQERSSGARKRKLLWRALLIAVAMLVVFFRVYMISEIPSEPFSDHAEKILDVYDVTQGETKIFFERNTGREGFQMYWTVLVSWIFGTGLSFISLKIGTVLLGLFTLPYMYLLGKEIGGRRVGLFTLLFTGVAYWPNVISRVGLRFPLYPLFVASTLYYLIRGLRTRNRNDFILSGLFLGIGLHGYSPIRILPIVVVFAVLLYCIHIQSKGVRRDALLWLVILGFSALFVFLPLLRYMIDNPQSFAYRAVTRLGSVEQPLPGPAVEIFLSNLWNGLLMFNFDNGEIWVHSVTHRPALDVISGALFLIGVLLLMVRYIRKRHWQDLFLLLSVPLLAMPSILSLAFPGENPALNRAGGAYVPVFIIVALTLESLVVAMLHALPTGRGRRTFRKEFIWVFVLGLLAWSGIQNYDLVFHQYGSQFDGGAWNSSEMGAVIKDFGEENGTTDTVWIVPYPHWVDTRLPGVWAGIPNRDFAKWREDLPDTVQLAGPKLFIVKANINVPEQNDQDTLDVLEQLYPQGVLELKESHAEGREFWLYSVPAQ